MIQPFDGTAVLKPYEPALSGWLVSNLPDLVLPLRAELMSGGRSNVTILLTDAGGNRYVLRRPPMGAQSGTAHDVMREAMIVAALDGSEVPVAPVLAICADADVIGAPFFVMRYVPGAVLTRSADASAPDLPRQGLAENLVNTLAAIHRVDLDAVGLGHLRRPAGYVKRQLHRLGRSLDPDNAFYDLAQGVRDDLERTAPEETGNGLLHGDFKLGNLIVGPDGGVRAVLDWELASTGDAGADLGWLVASWAQPDDGPWIVPPATTAGGFVTRAELAELYAAASRWDVADLDYYVAFAYWRWSCINIGTRRRYLAGAAPGGDIDISALDAQVEWQLDAAAQLLITAGR